MKETIVLATHSNTPITHDSLNLCGSTREAPRCAVKLRIEMGKMCWGSSEAYGFESGDTSKCWGKRSQNRQETLLEMEVKALKYYRFSRHLSLCLPFHCTALQCTGIGNVHGLFGGQLQVFSTTTAEEGAFSSYHIMARRKVRTPTT